MRACWHMMAPSHSRWMHRSGASRSGRGRRRGMVQEAAVSPMAAWHAFYLIIGTAAAALTLVPGTRLARPSGGIGTFSTPTVVYLVAPLLVATLLIAPWRALWQLGVVLGLAGLAGIAYGGVVVRRARRLE